jgi:hypothetical protein
VSGFRNRRAGQTTGFTFVEMVFAVAIMVTVTGAILSLMNPAHGVFKTQPELSEMQQRLRISVDAMYRDLVMAGAGVEAGSTIGPLGSYFAPVLPFRRGSQTPDPPGTFRTDRISVLYVPSSSSQGTTSLVMQSPDADVPMNPQAGCPPAEPLCRFQLGTTAVVFDESGAYDTFRITGIVNAPAALQHANQPLSRNYLAGASVAQVVNATYWLKTDASVPTSRLMRYDGHQSDLPIADDIIGLNFEYFGDPRPPGLRRLLTDPVGPWTTYGPRPPAPGVDDPRDSWPPGENCLFSLDPASGLSVPRPELHAFGTGAETLVRLDAAGLSDGPWCPDPADPARVDADLLRLRKIRVTVKVRGHEPSIPSQQVSFDVAPRNLNLGR